MYSNYQTITNVDNYLFHESNCYLSDECATWLNCTSGRYSQVKNKRKSHYFIFMYLNMDWTDLSATRLQVKSTNRHRI